MVDHQESVPKRIINDEPRDPFWDAKDDLEKMLDNGKYSIVERQRLIIAFQKGYAVGEQQAKGFAGRARSPRRKNTAIAYTAGYETHKHEIQGYHGWFYGLQRKILPEDLEQKPETD